MIGFKQPKSLGESGRGEISGLFRAFRKHGQFACAKKKGFRLEYRKPLLLNSLIGCGGLQCTETALLAVPFRYSLADALAA